MSRVRINCSTLLNGIVSLPPSKSYTHRALVMASLADGESKIENPLLSGDTKATINACIAMGAQIRPVEHDMLVKGCSPKCANDIVNVENSGTTLRFMTSIYSLPPEGYTVLTGDASLRQRPMQPLLDALQQLGVWAVSSRGNGSAPIIVKGGGIRGGLARIRGDISSQYISSLLISTPLAQKDTELLVSDAASKPYIDATMHMLNYFGIKVEREEYTKFRVEAGQRFKSNNLRIPADFSSASFIASAVAIAGGRVELIGANTRMPQADSAILNILEKMGCRIITQGASVIVESDGKILNGGSFDLRDSPDLLPVLSVLALKCDREVSIYGVAHARYKETDRISVMAQEISKLGVKVKERSDGLDILPAKELRKEILYSHADHRVFMALCLASMMVDGGCEVEGAETADISYPNFLRDIADIGVKVERIN
ncbi:MAG: 3-phosphoshikimate 1-carboxyvinyltransferase [Conexivisphaerales archaeon]